MTSWGVLPGVASFSWAAKDLLGRERALGDHGLSPTSLYLKLEGSETRPGPRPRSAPMPPQPPHADLLSNLWCQLSLTAHQVLLSGVAW